MREKTKNSKRGSLSIADGSTVKVLNSGTLNVEGTLNASGVTFTWADEVNEWGGINFRNESSNASQIENCIFRHAKGAAYSSNYHGVVSIRYCSPTIIGCIIEDCSARYGIYIDGSSTTPV